ncbi:MAG TPA: dTDP-4-dehydrorhamnose 3,5-epimerase [Phycisphaerae bacterium]|jgi:dTDP-4-dehydrorhamnose 3,5-epimerase|nr:dTDP-4-dehydrorhamnose 3,5-epimerase [Phycisphaerae bacterium]
MQRLDTSLPGCFEIRPDVHADARGTFVKTFRRDLFAHWGLQTDFAEQFWSTSRKGVLRGLHFQIPPMHHAKLVTCTAGRILDAVVDLRKNSATFRRHLLLELSAEKANLLYIPPGMAHGFYTLSDSATTLYNVTAQHSPAHDAGIRWDSAGIPWPDPHPLLSPRDAAFPALAGFDSPFSL